MKGNTLSKNMTQTDSLTLTNAQVTSITCTMLDLPISAPTNIMVGQCYFNPAQAPGIHSLRWFESEFRVGRTSTNKFETELEGWTETFATG